MQVLWLYQSRLLERQAWLFAPVHGMRLISRCSPHFEPGWQVVSDCDVRDLLETFCDRAMEMFRMEWSSRSTADPCRQRRYSRAMRAVRWRGSVSR